MGNGDDEIAEGLDEAHDALIEELLDAADVLGEIWRVIIYPAPTEQ